MRFLVFCAIAGWLAGTASAAEPQVVRLWKDAAPGETKQLPPEADTTKPDGRLVAGKRVIRLGNVSTPTITIVRPDTNAITPAVIICPGGGHHILAWDLEGTEVADWLASIGATGIVLKYRVPFRDPNQRWLVSVQDAQRAVSLVRSRAAQWKIDPKRIGLLGFSAGGEAAGVASLMSHQRQYPAQDAIDKVSSRPDFTALIYPGGLVGRGKTALGDHVTVTKDAPPMFFVHANDDRVNPLSSLLLATELHKAGVPVELHLYATGGHGYGLRPTNEPITRWPARFEAWLQTNGWLAK